MVQPTHDYANYRRVLCRTCFWKDDKSWNESVQPVIGIEAEGKVLLLRCGHSQLLPVDAHIEALLLLPTCDEPVIRKLAGCHGSGWLEPRADLPGGPYKCEGCAQCEGD